MDTSWVFSASLLLAACCRPRANNCLASSGPSLLQPPLPSARTSASSPTGRSSACACVHSSVSWSSTWRSRRRAVSPGPSRSSSPRRNWSSDLTSKKEEEGERVMRRSSNLWRRFWASWQASQVGKESWLVYDHRFSRLANRESPYWLWKKEKKQVIFRIYFCRYLYRYGMTRCELNICYIFVALKNFD